MYKILIEKNTIIIFFKCIILNDETFLKRNSENQNAFKMIYIHDLH